MMTNSTQPAPKPNLREPKAGGETYANLHDVHLARILQHLASGGHVKLFLDYDGTLVPIARRPEEAVPHAVLIILLGELASQSAFDITVLSGRHLDSLSAMVNLQGVTLAAMYGIEIQNADQQSYTRVKLETIRPILERVKKQWTRLIQGAKGFWIEDKQFGIALHARFASADDAAVLIPIADHIAARLTASAPLHRLGGERFLEVAPILANKGLTVEWLLKRVQSQHTLLVYFGDDDKDEQAFAVIRQHNGIPIIISDRLPDSQALVRLRNPDAVHTWLRAMCNAAASVRPAPFTTKETSKG